MIRLNSPWSHHQGVRRHPDLRAHRLTFVLYVFIFLDKPTWQRSRLRFIARFLFVLFVPPAVLSAADSEARPPGSDAELRSWLENMVWFHHFSTEEIEAATGLGGEAIEDALLRFGIRAGNRPASVASALVVKPYPGGRHPRRGFRDGAVRPQRETKFSVFLPWDAESYVVVDLPEAIWSNLGLTYLAHTHVPTIWTKEKIELPRLEWHVDADGTLASNRILPNGIAFGANVRAMPAAIRMKLWLRNGTPHRLSGLRVQNCMMLAAARGFEEQTNRNKLFRIPYCAVSSSPPGRWIIFAWQGCQKAWGNERCPCLHSDPQFEDCDPGEARCLQGWLSFYEGNDIDTELDRIERSGWRSET